MDYRLHEKYRVWLTRNEAQVCNHTRGVFNLVRTGRFVCYDRDAEKIRPVELWLDCPHCGHPEGWVPLSSFEEEEYEDGIECSFCAEFITRREPI